MIQGIPLEILKLHLHPGYSYLDHLWLHRLLVSLASDTRSPEATAPYQTVTAFDGDFMKDAGVSIE